jgi:mRNA interferase MazF
VNRGDIWTVAGGVYASKPRPAIVIQDDHFSETDSVVVIPLTSATPDAPLFRIQMPTDLFTGISRPSYAMIDKMTAVRRSNLGTRTGRVPTALLVDIERSIIVFLGLAA